MTVCVAFYKGRPRAGSSLRERAKYLFDWTIRRITRSPYSHCELAVPDTTRPGGYFCVSASVRDGGVRGKFMMLPDDRWDLLPVANVKGLRSVTESRVSDHLRIHQGQRYDWLGVFRFVCPLLRQSKSRWFCSEFVATVLGMDNPERQTPQTVYQYLKTT